MRNCGNCYNGHYNLSERGEEMYCDESEFMEEDVKENDCCIDHRYYPGMEESRYYLFYDASYMGPGYLIASIGDGKVNGFIKLYTITDGGFPFFAARAYIEGSTEDPDKNFSTMSFTFRDMEDDENGLYEAFTNLSTSLGGEKLRTIDPKRQGRNNIGLSSSSKTTTMTLSKDTYCGTQHPSKFIDILLGDEYSCEYYYDLIRFYRSLQANCKHEISSEELKTLIKVK